MDFIWLFHNILFYCNYRIEHADCVSCFLDSSSDFEGIKRRLTEFKTNIILCNSEHLPALYTGDEKVKLHSEFSLFDVNCAIVEVEELKCIPNICSNEDSNSNPKHSSKIFFYASTSGSCGELKSIGVTYKCFLPNINELG